MSAAFCQSETQVLPGDFELQKDLLQEMFIHLVRVEADGRRTTLADALRVVIAAVKPPSTSMFTPFT